MADTHVATRSGATAIDAVEATPPAEDYDAYDVPWRIDVPALRQLRIVRKELPALAAVPLAHEDPDGVLTLPGAVTVRRRLGLGGTFRLSTMTRLGVVALGTAAVGFIGSTSSVGDVAVPKSAAGATNPVGNARVIGADLWQAAAPRTSAWAAGPIVFARQDPTTTCASSALPSDRTASRRSTGTGAVGNQHVSRLATPQAASRLVGSYLANLRRCQRQALGGDGGSVQIRTLGTYPGVSDGLTVVGVFYRLAGKGPLGPATGANLFAVGRDGRFVTALELDVSGAPGRIPVEQFTAVAKAALTRLR